MYYSIIVLYITSKILKKKKHEIEDKQFVIRFYVFISFNNDNKFVAFYLFYCSVILHIFDKKNVSSDTTKKKHENEI